jgi:hypothetical protein
MLQTLDETLFLDIIFFSIHLTQRPASVSVPLAKRYLVAYEVNQTFFLLPCHRLEIYDHLNCVLNCGSPDRVSPWPLSPHCGSVSTLKQIM